jgi:hypothetical protein
MKMIAFWDIAPCSLVEVDRSFNASIIGAMSKPREKVGGKIEAGRTRSKHGRSNNKIVK